MRAFDFHQDQAQVSDELVLLDIDPRSSEHQETFIGVVKNIAREIFMPITVGGGVQSLDDFRLLLSSGADKVSANTAFVENPDLIDEASKVFGTQCVVLSLDYQRDEKGK